MHLESYLANHLARLSGLSFRGGLRGTISHNLRELTTTSLSNWKLEPNMGGSDNIPGGKIKSIMRPYCKGLRLVKWAGLPLKFTDTENASIHFEDHLRWVKCLVVLSK